MRNRLSERDYQTIRALRHAGALEDIDEELLCNGDKHVIVTCGDGHRIHDILTYKHRLLSSSHSTCLHMIAMSGGALTLAPFSPLAHRGSIPHCDAMLENIVEGCQFKGTNSVMLYAHFPCSAAELYSLSVVDALRLLPHAKDRLRERIPGVRLVTLVHVDYGGHRDGKTLVTYRFNRKKFEEWSALPASMQPAA